MILDKIADLDAQSAREARAVIAWRLEPKADPVKLLKRLWRANTDLVMSREMAMEILNGMARKWGMNA
jgi:hypothetical protein